MIFGILICLVFPYLIYLLSYISSYKFIVETRVLSKTVLNGPLLISSILNKENHRRCSSWAGLWQLLGLICCAKICHHKKEPRRGESCSEQYNTKSDSKSTKKLHLSYWELFPVKYAGICIKESTFSGFAYLRYMFPVLLRIRKAAMKLASRYGQATCKYLLNNAGYKPIR